MSLEKKAIQEEEDPMQQKLWMMYLAQWEPVPAFL